MCVRSDGQLVSDGLALFNRLEVIVEEVDVEAGLQDGSHRLRPAEEALVLVPVDPVKTQKVRQSAVSVDGWVPQWQIHPVYSTYQFKM